MNKKILHPMFLILTFILIPLLPTETTARAASSSIVISQVYGGGGNSGATYTHDFVELFNLGSTPVSIEGWTLQYTSAAGSTWQTAALSDSIPPGGYYLVQLAQGSGGTTPLPVPDASASIAMSGSNGKVALVSTATPLNGSCPGGVEIVDLVGYGSASCFEGGGAAPALGTTNAALRNAGGCTDSDDNSADFTAAGPAPRNSASPAAPCALPGDPSGVGAASPNPVFPGGTTLLTVAVTPGANPPSTGIAVQADLTSVGGAAFQPFFDDGSNGDVTPADNTFSFMAAIPNGTSPGNFSLPASISDAQGRSASLLISLEVAPSGANSPPVVAAGGPYSVLEGGAVTVIASGNDPDGDVLSYSWDLDGDGVYETPGQAVLFSAAGLDGPGNRTIGVRAVDPGGLQALALASVSVTNSAPLVSISPVLQTVQYSDPLQGMRIQSSDVGPDLPPDLSTRWNFNSGGYTDGLPHWLGLAPGGCGAGECSWLLSGTAAAPPGVYGLQVSLADKDGGVGTADITVAITPEDALATYTGALFAATASSAGSRAALTLAATVQDITVLDPARDPYPGDIRNAMVRFVDRDNGDAVLCSAPVGLVDPTDMKTGTATCNWTADLGSAASMSVRIGTVVSGHYGRSDPVDDALITVARPLAGSLITGGGFLLLEDSTGWLAGDAGSKANFGFNLRYRQSGRNPRGQFTLILRRTESDGLHVYQVRANAVSSFSVQPEAGTAIFNGKASIQDISDPLAPLLVDGNAALQVTIRDPGEPGTDDSIGITLWNKNGGLWFSSRWDGLLTVEQILAGGNLLVR